MCGTIGAKTGTKLAPVSYGLQLRTMARENTSPTQAAINALRGNSFLTLHGRLEQGGALQARKLSSGIVQLYWRYSLAGKTSREPIGCTKLAVTLCRRLSWFVPKPGRFSGVNPRSLLSVYRPNNRLPFCQPWSIRTVP